jgi:hypothetical protein
MYLRVLRNPVEKEESDQTTRTLSLTRGLRETLLAIALGQELHEVADRRRKTRLAKTIGVETRRLNALDIDARTFNKDANYLLRSRLLDLHRDQNQAKQSAQRASKALDLWDPAIVPDLLQTQTATAKWGPILARKACQLMRWWAIAHLAAGHEPQDLVNRAVEWLQPQPPLPDAKPIWEVLFLGCLAASDDAAIERVLATSPPPDLQQHKRVLDKLRDDVVSTWRTLRPPSPRRPLRLLINQYLPTPSGNKEACSEEVQLAESEGLQAFWKPNEHNTIWMEHIFAYWYNTSVGCEAERVDVVVDRDSPLSPPRTIVYLPMPMRRARPERSG